MITKRINPDGSVTIGIIEEEEPKVEKPKAEPKQTVKKTATKKSK